MNNLKQYRASRNVTQLDLAHRTGVSRTSIFNAENGHLSLELAEKCADALGVNRYDLLGLDAIVGNPSEDEMKIIEEELERNKTKNDLIPVDWVIDLIECYLANSPIEHTVEEILWNMESHLEAYKKHTNA